MKKAKRLRVIRIASEILAGTAVGFAVAFPVAYVTGTAFDDGALGFLAMFVLVFPPLYGPGSAVGVYLVGNRGNETSSFLQTLGCGFLGGLFMLVMIPVSSVLSRVLIVRGERIVLLALLASVLLIPPIFATIGFNSRRRHKSVKNPNNVTTNPMEWSLPFPMVAD